MIVKLPFTPDPRIQFIRNLKTNQLVLSIDGVAIQPSDYVETEGNIRPATLLVTQIVEIADWKGREKRVAEEFIAQGRQGTNAETQDLFHVDDRQRQRLAFVLKQYQIALSPEKPLQQSLISGVKILNFWCDLLEQRPKIQYTQERVLAKKGKSRPWTACLIQGQAILPYQLKGLPDQQCALYYVLVPQVDTLGIMGGSAVLTFYPYPSAQGVARRAFERWVDDYTTLHTRKVDEDGATLGADYTDDLTGRYIKEYVKTPEGKQVVFFAYVVRKYPDGMYDSEYFRFGADFEKVPCEGSPPDYKTFEVHSYLTFADLRAHQFSLLDCGARSTGKSMNNFDGTIFNLL
jgi:hypothetical protein